MSWGKIIIEKFGTGIDGCTKINAIIAKIDDNNPFDLDFDYLITTRKDIYDVAVADGKVRPFTKYRACLDFEI